MGRCISLIGSLPDGGQYVSLSFKLTCVMFCTDEDIAWEKVKWHFADFPCTLGRVDLMDELVVTWPSSS